MCGNIGTSSEYPVAESEARHFGPCCSVCAWIGLAPHFVLDDQNRAPRPTITFMRPSRADGVGYYETHADDDYRCNLASPQDCDPSQAPLRMHAPCSPLRAAPVPGRAGRPAAPGSGFKFTLYSMGPGSCWQPAAPSPMDERRMGHSGPQSALRVHSSAPASGSACQRANGSELGSECHGHGVTASHGATAALQPVGDSLDTGPGPGRSPRPSRVDASRGGSWG